MKLKEKNNTHTVRHIFCIEKEKKNKTPHISEFPIMISKGKDMSWVCQRENLGYIFICHTRHLFFVSTWPRPEYLCKVMRVFL